MMSAGVEPWSVTLAEWLRCSDWIILNSGKRGYLTLKTFKSLSSVRIFVSSKFESRRLCDRAAASCRSPWSVSLNRRGLTYAAFSLSQLPLFQHSMSVSKKIHEWIGLKTRSCCGLGYAKPRYSQNLSSSCSWTNVIYCGRSWNGGYEWPIPYRVMGSDQTIPSMSSDVRDFRDYCLRESNNVAEDIREKFKSIHEHQSPIERPFIAFPTTVTDTSATAVTLRAGELLYSCIWTWSAHVVGKSATMLWGNIWLQFSLCEKKSYHWSNRLACFTGLNGEAEVGNLDYSVSFNSRYINPGCGLPPYPVIAFKYKIYGSCSPKLSDDLPANIVRACVTSLILGSESLRTMKPCRHERLTVLLAIQDCSPSHRRKVPMLRWPFCLS